MCKRERVTEALKNSHDHLFRREHMSCPQLHMCIYSRTTQLHISSRSTCLALHNQTPTQSAYSSCTNLKAYMSVMLCVKPLLKARQGLVIICNATVHIKVNDFT